MKERNLRKEETGAAYRLRDSDPSIEETVKGEVRGDEDRTAGCSGDAMGSRTRYWRQGKTHKGDCKGVRSS